MTTRDAHTHPSLLESSAVDGLVVDATVQRGKFRLEVEFAVRPREILGVLGPNGAGKTTLLRILAGLTAPTTGSIRLDDQIFADVESGVFLPPERRPVGLLFQNYRLFPHLSVRDNVAFGPRCHGIERRSATVGGCPTTSPASLATTWTRSFACCCRTVDSRSPRSEQ